MLTSVALGANWSFTPHRHYKWGPDKGRKQQIYRSFNIVENYLMWYNLLIVILKCCLVVHIFTIKIKNICFIEAD